MLIDSSKEMERATECNTYKVGRNQSICLACRRCQGQLLTSPGRAGGKLPAWTLDRCCLPVSIDNAELDGPIVWLSIAKGLSSMAKCLLGVQKVAGSIPNGLSR